VSDPSESVSLVDRAYELIRAQVLECQLRPGSQVTERALSIAHDVGVAAVRGALARLATEGLVIPLPRVGYQITPITLRGVSELFEAWELVGSAIVRLAVSRRSSEMRLRFLEFEAPNPEAGHEFVVYWEGVWDLLVEASGNLVLGELHRRLNGDMHRLFALLYESAGHQNLSSIPIASIVDSSPDDAAETASNYIRGVREQVMRWMLTATSLADTAVSFR
jgi:DNA-binding GntR family transcriptional regulator